MNDMQELVTIEQAERLILLLAVGLPLLGLAVGAIIGALRRRAARGALVGLACGLSGPATWLLWRMYNGVTAVYGLDSVRGLLVNLALFVAAGLAIGVAVGLIWRRVTGARA